MDAPSPSSNVDFEAFKSLHRYSHLSFAECKQWQRDHAYQSSAPLSVRGQSQLDQAFRQLCSLLYRILECPPSELFSRSVAHHRVGRGHMTPVGFASLLFGIASALMLIGSTAFMIGIMMMPLVATLAMVFSFVGIFANLATPAMWSWSSGGGLDKKNGKEDCISGIWSGRGTE